MTGPGTIAVAVASLACLLAVPGPPVESFEELELAFRSGFEPDSTLEVPSSAWRDISGTDESVPAPNDWILDLDRHPKIGDFKLDLKAGTEEHRGATIVADPTGSGRGKVLRFWLRYPHEPSGSGLKGRVQANLTGLTAVHAVHHRVRMYLSEDFEILRSYPGTFTWLSLFEYWNDPNWGASAEAPFRVNVNIEKQLPGAGKPLTFRAKGQIMDGVGNPVVWTRTSEIRVPTGRWFTADLLYFEGDQQSGRFAMALTPDGGERRIVFDVHNFTRHPEDPTPGDGLPFFNPMKLYTSDVLIDFVRENGGLLEILWDDFVLWLDP